MTIVPIKAHLLWNDIQQIFRLKVSREEKEPGGNKIWVPLIIEEGTLVEAIQQLLLYWATSGTDHGGDERVGAPIGDLSALAAWISETFPLTIVGAPIMEAPEDFADVDPDLVPYVGEDDDWGVTTP